MDVKGLRHALHVATQHGPARAADIDRVMLSVRDRGGLTKLERRELLRAADGFDDATQQRLLTHLAAMGQTNAWSNIDLKGQLASIEGRYANLTLSVPGFSARVGLFDNTFSLKGRATAAGALKLSIGGHDRTVQVKAGEGAAAVLARVTQTLPTGFAGVLLGGDVQPWEAPSVTGGAPSPTDDAAHVMLYRPEALGLKSGTTPARIVVTGYGAFMGVTDNPSARMAQLLAERGVQGGLIEYRRLDVTPAAVEAFIEEMRRSPPAVILSMGVGGQAQVEEQPENKLGAGVDGNDAPMLERPVRLHGPDVLKTDLPVQAIDWAVEQFGAARQVFTSLSDPNYQPDRSAYLCNFLGYHLAAEFGGDPDTTAGFMHINGETKVEQMAAVLDAITATHLEQRRA